MSLDSLIQNIDSGKYKATVFTSENCPYCPELKHNLDILGVPYKETTVDEDILEEFEIKYVPVLHLSNNGTTVVIQNEPLEKLRARLSNLEI